MTYVTETWSLTMCLMRKPKVIQRDQTRNEDIRKRNGTTDITQRIDKLEASSKDQPRTGRRNLGRSPTRLTEDSVNDNGNPLDVTRVRSVIVTVFGRGLFPVLCGVSS